METIRRSTVIIWLALGVIAVSLVSMVAAHTMRHRDQPQPSLVLKAGDQSGSLTVYNKSDAAIEVERKLGIERKASDHWTPIVVDFELISNCAEAKQTTERVSIPVHGSIKVVSWTGYSCSGQCTRSCRANIDYSPGAYRFVATLSAGGAHVYSDPFQLSAVK